VRAFDPVAMEETRRIYGEREDLELTADAMTALDGADALVIVTEWSQFRSPDFAAIRSRLRQPVVFDGRNILDPRQVSAAGITYVSIGRTRCDPPERRPPEPWYPGRTKARKQGSALARC